MNDVTWETLDWDVLDRLRAIFLSEAPPHGGYWKSAFDLANYDFTFGRRIAWKWDAVLREEGYYCLSVATLDRLFKQAGFAQVRTLRDRLPIPLIAAATG
jgi:hypothetical protein